MKRGMGTSHERVFRASPYLATGLLVSAAVILSLTRGSKTGLYVSIGFLLLGLTVGLLWRLNLSPTNSTSDGLSKLGLRMSAAGVGLLMVGLLAFQSLPLLVLGGALLLGGGELALYSRRRGTDGGDGGAR
jgi:hypothetical protein